MIIQVDLTPQRSLNFVNVGVPNKCLKSHSKGPMLKKSSVDPSGLVAENEALFSVKLGTWVDCLTWMRYYLFIYLLDLKFFFFFYCFQT